MTVILDGKKISAQIGQELSEKLQAIKASGGKVPHLAIVLIGQELASQLYVHNKIRAGLRIGFKITLIQHPSIHEQELLDIIHTLNQDEDVHGIILQLPLPSHLCPNRIISHILPIKDVDGLHPNNYGKMAKHLPSLIPATPLGILELIRRYRLPTAGKHCVIIGRSYIVGSPLSILLSRQDYPGYATVTLCHSQTMDLSQFTKQADILICAVGHRNLITKDMVKPGAIVFDVGITRVQDPIKKTRALLYGDVDFSQVALQCSYITPVPGGVGPMTVAALLSNTLQAAHMQEQYRMI